MPDKDAAALLEAYDSGTQVAPLSDSHALTLDKGYGLAAQIHAMRTARGERPVGRKIGFTNRTIWPIYNVNAPVWGWIYDSTLHDIPADGVIALPNLPEVRLEPEIAFGLSRAPEPDMTPLDLATICIDWAAHSLELVFSAYPGWRFTAPDTAAAFGMHGALWLGDRVAAAPAFGPDGKGLDAFTLTLSGPNECHTGASQDVLGSPLLALAHLVGTLTAQNAPALQAGDVITTGTLTDARPIHAGQRWRTDLSGTALPGLDVTFSA